MDLKKVIRHVYDFPKKGIDFIDITTVLKDGEAFKYALDCMKDKLSNIEFDVIAAPEARGFVFAAPIAYSLNKGFVPIRKKNKLPYKTVSAEYELEYGTDILEMHEDAFEKGARVIIIDDLLATGGTTCANIELIEKLGGSVELILFFAELEYLNGRKNLSGYNCESILKFDA